MQGRKLETELKQKPWVVDAYWLVPLGSLILLSYILQDQMARDGLA